MAGRVLSCDACSPTACAITEEVKPRNSELVTIGQDSVFRCIGPMQTAVGNSEQLAVCDHTTGSLTAGSLQPCDREDRGDGDRGRETTPLAH